MAVGTDVVAVRYEDIVAGTPISVPYPVYEALDILVYYGAASLQAVFNTDYTVSLADDFDTFTLTPTASLLTKINNLIAANPADEVNYITVRRRLDYLTDSTAAAVRYTPFTSREFERTVLRFQQIQEQLNRCVSLTPNFVGDEPRIQIAELVANRVLMADATGTNVIAGPTAAEIEGAESAAETATTKAAQAVSAADTAVAAVASLVNRYFDSRAAAIAADIDEDADYIVVAGYDAIGEGAPTPYLRISSLSVPPLTSAEFTSNDGSHWRNAANDFNIAKHFGAKEGDFPDRNAQAIRDCLELGKRALIPPNLTSSGFELGDNTFEIGDGVKIGGADDAPTLVRSAAGANSELFRMNGQLYMHGISGLQIEMGDAHISAAAIRYATDELVTAKSVLHDIIINEHGLGITTVPGGGSDPVEMRWNRIKFERPRGRSVFMERSNGFYYMNDINVDCTKLDGTLDLSEPQVELRRFIGAKLTNCAVTGQAVAQLGDDDYLAGATGFKFDGVDPATRRFLWLDFVRVEATRGNGIEIGNTYFVNGRDVESFAALGFQIYVEAVGYIEGSQWRARGSNDYPGAEAVNAHGISFVGCNDIQIKGIRSAANTGSGVYVLNTTNAALDDIKANDNTGYALLEAGTSDANKYTDLDSDTNAAGVAVLVGPNSSLNGVITNGVKEPRDASAFHAYCPAGASISAGVATKVPFTTLIGGNRGGYWDGINSRWTPPAGQSNVSGALEFATGPTVGGALVVQLRRNGALYDEIYEVGVNTGAHSVPFNFDFTTDGSFYWEIWAYCSGAASTVSASSARTFIHGASR